MDDGALIRHNVLTETDLEDVERRQGALEKIRKDFQRYQHHCMDFYHKGVTATVAAMGGLDTWQSSSKQDRLEVFGKLWDLAPEETAIATMGQAASVVPFQDIFSDTKPNHTKWQMFHSRVFLMTCESIYKLRIASPVTRKEQAYKEWNALIKTEKFEDLALGTIEDISIN